MKPTAYLNKLGCGAIVKEDDLYKVLRKRPLQETAIDVFEVEPIKPGHPLLELTTLSVTPHSAYYSVESLYALQYGAAAEVARVLKGEEPHSNRKQLRRYWQVVYKQKEER